MTALDRAIEQLDGVTAFASKLGLAPNVVTNWRMREQVPHDRCAAIELATGGAVRCEELRPDIPWTRGPSGEPLIDAVAWGKRRKEAA